MYVLVLLFFFFIRKSYDCNKTIVYKNLSFIFLISLLFETDMAGSIVFTHYEFLKKLGKENNDRARILYIRTINADIMRALSKVVYCVQNNYVPTLSYDQRAFHSDRYVMRHITSPSISLARKKRTLELHNRLIPRFLREHYIINTCLYELRQSLGIEHH